MYRRIGALGEVSDVIGKQRTQSIHRSTSERRNGRKEFRNVRYPAIQRYTQGGLTMKSRKRIALIDLFRVVFMWLFTILTIGYTVGTYAQCTGFAGWQVVLAALPITIGLTAFSITREVLRGNK